MRDQQPKIAIIGGGLAGSEAALQLAKRNIAVTLYDMKPAQRSPAHHSSNLAEIVCSNSLGNLQLSTASGLLKQELRLMGCQLLEIAHRFAVPAGNALAVDRERFSEAVTEKIASMPQITRVTTNVNKIPPDEADFAIIATGPLTSPELTEAMQQLLNQEQLYFFDAAAPVIMRDSIDFDAAFFQNRHNRSQNPADAEGSYINCPLDKLQYLALIDCLLTSEKIPQKDFEAAHANFFESCLPVEVLASRGVDTLRYGPMKPIGIQDPRTGARPYAVVQLRQDNREGTLYNMVGFQTNLKWGDQKRLIQMIPGLTEAEIVRYGVMHRNTYLNSPELLHPALHLRRFPQILIAGQLTGVEGYTESIAAGLMASLTLVQHLAHREPVVLPAECMMGALFQYITRPEAKNFQPINSNWGILPPLSTLIRDKQTRNRQLAERSLTVLKQFIADQPQLDLQQRDALEPTVARMPY